MFERFEESGRAVVVTAQEHARSLRHPALGGEHLLLGIVEQDPILLSVPPDALRAKVIAIFGIGEEAPPASMPFTTAAQRAMELAYEEAADRDHGVRPAHLLLALLRVDDGVRSLVEGLGRPLDEVVELAQAASQRSRSRRPPDVHQALREGHPMTVTLGHGDPLGDLGNRRTDARLLLAMLVADGAAAKLLRNHGIDEAALRRLAPGL